MVVNDHDAVNAPGLTVFCDVWEITGISLPDFTEFVFFIGLAVTEVRVSGRFEVVVADEALYGIHTDSCREKGFLHEMLINLCGIHARMVIFHTINFSNGFVIQSPGNAFVRPDTGHQGIHPMVVWSEDRNIRSEHFLMVLCVF